MTVLYYDKYIGETLGEFMKRIKNTEELKDTKISFAGRLDPLAYGKMMILTDEDCKLGNIYNKFDKTYEFSIIFGISSDSLDPLNNNLREHPDKIYNDDNLEEIVYNNFIYKTYNQEYPVCSSKTVNYNGKMTPLWKVYKAGNINSIKIPSKYVEIKDFTILSKNILDASVITNMMTTDLNYVNDIDNSFGKYEAINFWRNINHKFSVYRCRVNCSSGTYIRKLVHDIGNILDINCIAFRIHRKFYEESI